VKRRKVKRLIRRDIKGWRSYFGLNEWAIVVTVTFESVKLTKHSVVSCTAI